MNFPDMPEFGWKYAYPAVHWYPCSLFWQRSFILKEADVVKISVSYFSKKI